MAERQTFEGGIERTWTGTVATTIRAAQDCLADKPWQVISLYAGDGRDLLGVLATHPRLTDARGLLIERLLS